MNNYTKGPWIKGPDIAADADGFAISQQIVETSDGLLIVAECCAGISTLEQQANARLIAAAPELLDKLKQFTKVTPDTDPIVMFALIEQAKELIKKATGGI